MSEIIKKEEKSAEVVQYEGDAILSVIERAAQNPNVDIDKMERLFEMRERAMDRQAKIDFNVSFPKMKAEIPTIFKKGVGQNESKFAELADILEAIDPVLEKHGFSVYFETKTEGSIWVKAICSHEGGHSISAEITLPSDTGGQKNAVQSVGSALFYGQRYSLKTLLNLKIKDKPDDDGFAAGGGETVSSDQMAEIYSLIEEAKADKDKMMAWLNVGSIEKMPIAAYNAAKTELTRRIEKANKNG